MIALGGKNKLGFLEGKHPKPTTGDEEIQKWERCDFMVKSWLLASMKPDVAAKPGKYAINKSAVGRNTRKICSNQCTSVVPTQKGPLGVATEQSKCK